MGCLQYNNYHPIMGILIFIMILIQPLTGSLHHRSYRRHQKRRSVSHIHIWIGRIAITLGIINGGLGMYVAGNATGIQLMAYALLATLVWVAWLAAACFGEWRKYRRDVPRKPRKGRRVRGSSESTEMRGGVM
jgi:sulfite exporter TauE/SafE